MESTDRMNEIASEINDNLRTLVASLVRNRSIYFADISGVISVLLDNEGGLAELKEKIDEIVETVEGLSFADEKTIGELRRLIAEFNALLTEG